MARALQMHVKPVRSARLKYVHIVSHLTRANTLDSALVPVVRVKHVEKLRPSATSMLD